MKILVINCGSSTLKFDFINIEVNDASHGQESRLMHGIFDGIGAKVTMRLTVNNNEQTVEELELPNHTEATEHLLNWLERRRHLGLNSIEAVGHRVVHGGDQFIETTLINDDVVNSIEALSILAPLHNEPSINAIKAVRGVINNDIPMVAVFDTAFHCTLPERAWRYALPNEVAARHHVRRYGFHGLAHRFMTERYAEISQRLLGQVNLITLQLGNGCSAAAVKGGCSVDTSMGFTPLEGLMMGTRSGDIDPSVVGYLSRVEGVDVQEVDHWLNTQSGLFGVSGRSMDMRELLEAELQGDALSALAIDMFCYRVRKYIGAYLAVLGGANAIVFGGGIGENAPSIRARICDGLEWCGVALDEASNVATTGTEGRISADDSEIQAYVIPPDESLVIARDTVDCLKRHWMKPING
jgi:acetate kinase